MHPTLLARSRQLGNPPNTIPSPDLTDPAVCAQVNVAIHVVCVPAIFTTALILSHGFGSPSFLTLAPPAFLVPLIGSHLIQFTPTFLVALSYAAYFIVLDPVAGGIYAPLLTGMGHFSNVFYETNGEAMKIAGAVSPTPSWEASPARDREFVL